MIRIVEDSDILATDCKYIVNEVNCDGEMANGIAKRFAEKYPKMLEEYKKLCNLGCYEPCISRIHNENGKYIINFPITKNVQSKINIKLIINGLKYLKERLYQDYQNEPMEIAFYPIGYDKGLKWDEINDIINTYFNDEIFQISIYKPINNA